MVVAGVTIAAVVVVAGRQKQVLCIGDSLTYQSSAALKADLSARGFAPQVIGIGGSGLLDTKVNWASIANREVSELNPDVVVVEFIGNYGIFGTRPGIADKTPAFYSAWAAAAQQLEDILTSRRAQVYWVVGPPVERPADQAKITALAHIYENLHAPNTRTKHPLTIDAIKPFSDATGGYAEYLPGPNGAPVQIRLPDGTHFTLAGIARFGQVVAQAVAAGPTRLFASPSPSTAARGRASSAI
jgi:hypothetical protein